MPISDTKRYYYSDTLVGQNCENSFMQRRVIANQK